MSRLQAGTEIRMRDFDWKGKVGGALLKLHVIPDTFTGKIVITFKEGEIGHLVKKELLK